MNSISSILWVLKLICMACVAAARSGRVVGRETWHKGNCARKHEESAYPNRFRAESIHCFFDFDRLLVILRVWLLPASSFK